MSKAKTTESEVSDLIKRLKHYNDWRRGADTQQPDPKQLGKDIDTAIAIISIARGAIQRATHKTLDE